MKSAIIAILVANTCLEAGELRISFENPRPVGVVWVLASGEKTSGIGIYESFKTAPSEGDFSYEATNSLRVTMSDAKLPVVIEGTKEEFRLTAEDLKKVQRFSDPLSVRRIDVFYDTAGCSLYLFASKEIWKVEVQKGKELSAESVKEDQVPRMKSPLRMIKKAAGESLVFEQELTEQGADQPATAPESEPEGGDNSKLESESAPR